MQSSRGEKVRGSATGVSEHFYTNLVFAPGQSVEVFSEHEPVEALLSHRHVHAENLLNLNKPDPVLANQSKT